MDLVDNIQQIKDKVKVSNVQSQTFKNCTKVSVVSYEPLSNITDDEIYDFVNFKSNLMKQNNIFLGAEINVMIEYKNIGWKSTRFLPVGQEIENVFDYNEMDAGDIISFKIAFILKN